MSVLVVGLSHKSASLAVLERAVVSGDALAKLLRDVSQAPNVAGRVRGVHLQPGRGLRRGGQVPRGRVRLSASCWSGTRGVAAARAHPASVRALRGPCGAAPARGGLRAGLDGGRREPDPRPGPPGPGCSPASRARSSRGLGELGALALRTGKRAHAETGIDRAGANLVSVGIGLAAQQLAAAGHRRPAGRPPGPRPAGPASRWPGARPGGRGRLDELARRRHRGPARRRAASWSPTAPWNRRRTAGRRGRR